MEIVGQGGTTPVPQKAKGGREAEVAVHRAHHRQQGPTPHVKDLSVPL